MGIKTSELSIIIRARDRATAGLKKTGAGISRFAAVAKTKFAAVKASVLSLRTAFIGLIGVGVMGKLTKSFIKAASTIEDTRVAMELLLGDTKEAAKLMKNLNTFASKVPFTFEEIAKGASSLSGVLKGGRKEVEAFLPLIADLAAFGRTRGITFEQTTQQLVRMFSAGAASADLFREKGITAMLGFQMGVRISAEDTKNRIIDAWTETGSKFRGLAGKMAENWSGQMSMLEDAWFQFKLAVMDSGVFEFLKKGLNIAVDLMRDFRKEGPKIASQVLDVLKKLAWTTAAIADAITVMQIAMKGFLAISVTAGLAVRKMFAFFARGAVDLAAFLDVMTGTSLLDSPLIKGIRKLAEAAEEDVEKTKSVVMELANEIENLRAKGSNVERLSILFAQLSDSARGFTEQSVPISTILGNFKTKAQEINSELALGRERWKEIEQAAAKTRQTIERIGGVISSSIVGAIGQAIDGTLKWRDAVKGLLKDLALAITRMILMQAVKGIAGALAGGTSSAIGPGFQAMPARGRFGEFMAKGGIIGGGHLPTAQKGMVVKGPTVIGDNPGGVEAAVPLERDTDGVLGVRQVGGGGNFTVNIGFVDIAGAEAWLMSKKEAIKGAVQEIVMESGPQGLGLAAG